MRPIRSPFFGLGLAVLGAAAPAVAQSKKASIAVAPFTFHRDVRARPDAELETGMLTKKFITALGQSRKFDVVERDQLDRLLEEMQLSDAGFTDPKRAIQAGKMFGVDYFLLGEVSVFTVTTRVTPIPRTSWWLKRTSVRLIADMRIVDSRTSKIVATEKGDVNREWKKRYRDRPSASTRVEPAILDEVQRELCEQLVLKVINAVYPLKVLKVNQAGVVFVNRGQGGGVAEGEVYDTFVPGEELVDPDTGESLGSEETKVGRIRITQVLPKFSKAAVVAGRPAAGQICRLARGPADFAPPPPPPPPADTQPPTIRILAPKSGQRINAAPVNVAATVIDNDRVSRVTINGVEAAQDPQGRYRARISKPNEGKNGVRVEAWDASGNHAVATCEFVFDSRAPEVEADATILVEGKVDDLECTLTINGVPVEFDRQTGAYSVRVPADPQDPGRVVIVATDAFGNKTTEVRRVR